MGNFVKLVKLCLVTMPQEQKLVELGRVVHVTTGPNAGKVCAIVDIIDAKRMLVDRPDFLRQEVKLKDMFLTRILLKTTDVPSHKALCEMWKRQLVDERYKMTVHAQRIEKFRRRAACTDFEYFKVRCATRQANKIKENCLVNLHAKHPRALVKMDRKRRIDMGVRLGYRTLKKLTPEEKAVKEAREKIIKANRKVKKTPAAPRVPTIKIFRRERDATRKADATFRKTHTKALQENRAAIKAAVKAGTKPPHKLHAKTVKAKRSTLRASLKKRKEVKKAAAAE